MSGSATSSVDFGDLNRSGNYSRHHARRLHHIARSRPCPTVLHQPLKLNELLAANLSKGEFYEEQIDWQATMFQPIGGMDRIPYGFAQSLGDIIHYECIVKEITTGDRSVTVAYTKSDTPRPSPPTSASAPCPSPFFIRQKTTSRQRHRRPLLACP